MDQMMEQKGDGMQGEGQGQGQPDGMAIIQSVDDNLSMIGDAISSAPNGQQFAARIAKIKSDFQAVVQEAMAAAQGGQGAPSQGGGVQPVQDMSQGTPMGMQGGMR
jgi:hypothetical protein